ncbi:MAG: hypothetical protein RLZZ385_1809 [Pseudomonadota bacterium]|jgi:L-threonylcarbamoyladenylate synthase
MTHIFRGDSPQQLDQAADLLRAGGVVAFPTETVYGLGADGLNSAAVEKIFLAKGRPPDNPVILHVASFAEALALWDATDTQIQLAGNLAQRFWPGPLTLVLKAASHIPSVVTAGLPTVAVRQPDHPLALALIRRVGRPLAAPSANLSGRPSPTSAEHVLRTLSNRIDGVVDGGPTAVGLESTVVDLTCTPPRILRPGAISAGQLAERLGFPCDQTPQPEGGSPGLRHRHYQPRNLEVRLVNEATLAGQWQGDAAILCRQTQAGRLGPRAAPLEALPDTAEEFAVQLYAALYRLEQAGASRLLIARVPSDPAWTAVADRLQRAAGAKGSE